MPKTSVQMKLLVTKRRRS